MARHKDVNWDLTGKDGEPLSRDQIVIAVLMDLRDELKGLNKKLDRQNDLLVSIRRNTAWARKKQER